MEQRGAVFLDRDGTINVEAGYLYRLDDLVLIPGAAGAIAKLNKRKIPAILTTNQSGPARGYFPESHVKALNQRLCDLLAKEGAYLDAIYYCPHLAQGIVADYAIACDCRKPGTKMVLDASREYALDVRRSYVVGDKSTDVELGHNAGCRTILLRTGYGEQTLANGYHWAIAPHHVATDLADAVDWILADMHARAS